MRMDVISAVQVLIPIVGIIAVIQARILPIVVKNVRDQAVRSEERQVVLRPLIIKFVPFLFSNPLSIKKVYLHPFSLNSF